ncbi:type IV pilus biogenesis protein PilM [Bacillus sp. FJAT-42315]|uniref:type IV pilus biogenesis protein PilM n=1 Tax=Bacillus sp. FJAT-42315 TaxID=2014077 RepID=UPI000C243562|nr:pilus assembly protein PilM [Bacillus sp. FJAT-42315]
MAIRFFSKKDRTVNLVFTDYAIRFVELRQTVPPIVQSVEERALPAGVIRSGEIIDYEALLEIMKNCVDEWGIKRREARFIVPDHYIAMKEERLKEDIADDELKSYLFMQIGTTIHLPFEEPVFDAVVVGEKDGKKHVLVIAAPEERVLHFRELLEEVKLKPKVADISPLSLYRLYYYQGLTSRSNHELVLQLKRNLLTVAVFHEHQLKFVKPVRIESSSDVAALLQGESTDQHLANLMDALKELENIINFYENSLHKGQVQISKAFLNGDHSQIAYMQSYIAKTLGLEVISDEHMEIVDKAGNTMPGAFFTAIGLGLKEV